MTNKIKFLATAMASLAFVQASHAASTLITDNFSSNTISSDSRLKIGSGPNWVKFSSNIWTVSGGVASNAGTIDDRDGEGGLLRVYDVGAASLPDETQLTFSFTYDVGDDATLFFHAYGLYGGTTTGAGTQLHNTGVTDGTIQTQFDGGGAGGDFTGINFKDGTLGGSGNGGTAFSGALTGTGTFSQTIVLGAGAYATAGINNINDLQYLTMGWASNISNIAGDSAISVDNFSLTAIPEPSTYALLAGLTGLVFVMVRRRRA